MLTAARAPANRLQALPTATYKVYLRHASRGGLRAGLRESPITLALSPKPIRPFPLWGRWRATLLPLDLSAPGGFPSHILQYLDCCLLYRALSSPVTFRLSAHQLQFSNPTFPRHHATNYSLLVQTVFPKAPVALLGDTPWDETLVISNSNPPDEQVHRWEACSIFVASAAPSQKTQKGISERSHAGRMEFLMQSRPKRASTDALDFMTVISLESGGTLGYLGLIDGGRGYVLIAALWVDEHYRRRGIGTRLVLAARRALSAGQRLCVSCFDSNEAALRLYRACSFNAVGTEWRSMSAGRGAPS